MKGGRVRLQIVHDFLIEHFVAWQDVRHSQDFSLVKKKKIIYCACTSSWALPLLHPPRVFPAFPVIAALLLPCLILNTNETTNMAGMGTRPVPDVPKFGYVTALAHMYV